VYNKVGAEPGPAVWDFGTCGAISSMAMDHYGFGTGDEMRSQGESRTQRGGKERKKEGAKLVFFPPKLLLSVVSPPVLDLHYLYLYCCSFSS